MPSGKIEISPAYVPLIQKPSCCAAACLQMILYRRGFGLYDQEDLAEQLGIPVGEKYRSAFRANLPFPASPSHWFETINSEGTINRTLEHYYLPLIAKAHRTSQVADTRMFVAWNLSKNNDVWTEFHWNERDSIDAIHDNVIQSIEYDAESCHVTTIDPYSRSKQIVRWPLEMLERSIGTKYGRECGFVIVSPK